MTSMFPRPAYRMITGLMMRSEDFLYFTLITNKHLYRAQQKRNTYGPLHAKQCWLERTPMLVMRN